MWRSKFVGVAVYEGCSVCELQCLVVVLFISCGVLINGLIRPLGQNTSMNASIPLLQHLRRPNLASRRLRNEFQDTRVQI